MVKPGEYYIDLEDYESASITIDLTSPYPKAPYGLPCKDADDLPLGSEGVKNASELREYYRSIIESATEGIVGCLARNYKQTLQEADLTIREACKHIYDQGLMNKKNYKLVIEERLVFIDLLRKYDETEPTGICLEIAEWLKKWIGNC